MYCTHLAYHENLCLIKNVKIIPITILSRIYFKKFYFAYFSLIIVNRFLFGDVNKKRKFGDVNKFYPHSYSKYLRDYDNTTNDISRL